VPSESYLATVLGFLDRIADEVGRLRARAKGEPNWIAERLADHVESLDAFVCITAAELVRRGVEVEQALRLCDDRKIELLRRMRDPRAE